MHQQAKLLAPRLLKYQHDTSPTKDLVLQPQFKIPSSSTFIARGLAATGLLQPGSHTEQGDGSTGRKETLSFAHPSITEDKRRRPAKADDIFNITFPFSGALHYISSKS